MAQKQVAERKVSPTGYTPEEEKAHCDLIAAGLLKEIKPRTLKSKMDRPVGIVIGQPISETIIEDRR